MSLPTPSCTWLLRDAGSELKGTNRPTPHARPRRRTPNEPATPQRLADLGVLYWKLDADAFAEDYQRDPKLAAIRKARNYSYTVRGCVLRPGWWGGGGPAGKGPLHCLLPLARPRSYMAGCHWYFFLVPLVHLHIKKKTGHAL